MAHAAVATAMPVMSTPVCGEVALASVVAPVTVEEKARLDGEYRRNMGFRLDARIFFRSFVVVLGRFGYAEVKEEDGQAYSDFSQEDEVGLCESPSGGRAA